MTTVICNTCNRPDHRPFRAYDVRGRIINGCVDAIHTGRLVQPSESNSWHNRPEAKKIRAVNKKQIS